MARQPLTAYLLTKAITSLDSADPAITNPDAEVDVPDRDVFRSRLFVSAPPPSSPPWAGYLQGVLHRELNLAANSFVGALLLVEATDSSGNQRVVAFTFGVTGQHLLRRGWYVRGFGLRCALNACFPRKLPSSALTSLRSIDSKSFDEVALDTRQLASRQVDFDVFGMNIQADLLRAILGNPVDDKRWGSRVSGKDSFQFSALVSTPLTRVAREAARLGTASDYKKHFPWVDNIKPVDDAELIVDLQDAAVEAVRAGALDLGGPEELDHTTARYYRIKGDSRINQRYVLELASYVKHIGGAAGVSIDRLRSDWIKSYDDAGKVVDEKPVFDCLVGDLLVGGVSYVIADGEFYEVERGFMRKLDNDIRALSRYQGLPASTLDESEGAYNERVSAGSPDLLLLDKNNLSLQGRTTPVEACDLLSREGAFIHVKRHVRSATLSHLFSQGAVSGELLVSSEDFRKELRELVQRIEAARLANDATYQLGVSECISAETPDRFAHEVVFAIITRWKNRPPVEVLPFFSKLNLRQRADELYRLGFKVSIATVDHP